MNGMPTKSSELRKGNVVNLCFDHKPGWFTAKVIALHKDGTIDTDTKESKKRKYYWEGLILTDNILDKLGFVWQDGDYPGWYGPEFKGWWIRIWKKADDNFRYSINDVKSIQVTYLHQLQNLYLSLTGQELEVNL